MKSKKMRCTDQVAGMCEKRNAYRVLVGQSQGKDHLEDLGVDVRIILKWELKKKWWECDDWINLA
jgi:hypothetical protein